ncbi:MAG: putative DNA-binding domain-containing protein, partial [Zetaproteobacteria bacterium]|nr:putative DNA-binding domain-containing protein [Zetaproteobacteria bacterium]
MLPYQSKFADAIFQPDAPSTTQFTQQLGYAHRIEAYQQGYPARIHEALAEALPHTQKCLEEDFLQLAEEYAYAVRPTHFDLSNCPQGIPMFLRNHPLARHYPWLIALTELEVSKAAVFHELWENILSPTQLHERIRLEGAQALIKKHPKARELHCTYAMDSMLIAIQSGKDLFQIPPNTLPQTQRILIGRRGYTTQHHCLNGQQSIVWQELHTALTMESLCERLTNHPDLEGKNLVPSLLYF